MVKPRFRAEKAPDVFTRYEKDIIEFLKRDRKTVHETPDDVEIPTVTNPLEEFVGVEDVTDGSSAEENKRMLDDCYEDNITAVMPVRKRQKMSNDNHPSTNIVNDNISVEVRETQSVPLTTPIPHDISQDATHGPSPILITQDNDNDNIPEETTGDIVPDVGMEPQEGSNDGIEDTDPDVEESVNYEIERNQLERSDDELFHSITSHEWDRGVLLLGLKWKTDEISMCPFSLV